MVAWGYKDAWLEEKELKQSLTKLVCYLDPYYGIQVLEDALSQII